MRRDREDTRAQAEALTAAREDLARALDVLADDAKTAAKAARTKRGRPDLDAVYTSARHVARAEEAVDLAAYDLQTASGEHG